MPSFDTRPKPVDIDHLAGDTLAIRVNASAEFVAGRTWRAQARKNRTDAVAAATFVCYPDTDGCLVVLESADNKSLAADGVWRGFWDVQLAEADGSDPVNTLAGGKLNLHPDVTRTP